MPQENYYIAHWGIKGQKWGLRRFRNYDDTLTEAGKRRYGDGGARAIKKAEKERQRRAQILADPTKLYKHRSEFTNAEIENAMAKFDTAARLKEAARKEKADRRAELERKILGGTKEERLEKAAMKDKFKTQHEKEESERDIAKAKAEQEKQRLKAAKAQEQRNVAAEERKIESEKKDEKSKKWGRRASTVGNILKLSTSAKVIFDELGITDPNAGKTLFGSLGKSLGFGEMKASDVAKEKSKEKSSEKGDSSGGNTGSTSDKTASDKVKEAFAGWATDNEYKDTSKKEAKAAKKEYKEYSKEWWKSVKDMDKKTRSLHDAQTKGRDKIVGDKVKGSVPSVDDILKFMKSRVSAGGHKDEDEFIPYAYGEQVDAKDPKSRSRQAKAKSDFIDVAASWARNAYSNVPVAQIEQAAEKYWLDIRKGA